MNFVITKTSSATHEFGHRLHVVVWDVLNGTKHIRALWLYMLVAGGHFFEHLVQISQVYLLGIAPKDAGGVLGQWLPGLATNEVLHMSYNSLQLTGLILLWPGFRHSGRAKIWWQIAIVAQIWHFLEHVLLQVQYLTGYYLFESVRQTSLLELFFPRVELHFIYNLLAFTPTVIALILYLHQTKSRAATPRY
jgi:hypothetical protein